MVLIKERVVPSQNTLEPTDGVSPGFLQSADGMTIMTLMPTSEMSSVQGQQTATQVVTTQTFAQAMGTPHVVAAQDATDQVVTMQSAHVSQCASATNSAHAIDQVDQTAADTRMVDRILPMAPESASEVSPAQVATKVLSVEGNSPTVYATAYHTADAQGNSTDEMSSLMVFDPQQTTRLGVVATHITQMGLQSPNDGNSTLASHSASAMVEGVIQLKSLIEEDKRTESRKLSSSLEETKDNDKCVETIPP